MKSYRAMSEIDVITSSFPIPGLGFVPINAFVLKGAEPILVDTGSVVESPAFMETLRSVIDPAELKWLWLTHPDADHIGSLQTLLSENPSLRVITTFLGVGILSLYGPPPLDRVYLLNPGEKLELKDRTLTAFKPPAFDNPATTGFYDDKSRVVFSSDCFGALLADPPENAADLSEKDLREGQTLWATIDSPWLHRADRSLLAAEIDKIRRMEPAMLLSSHLPAADGRMAERLLSTLAGVPEAAPFVGPNQPMLEQMLKQMAAAS